MFKIQFSTGSPNLLTMVRYYLNEPTADLWADVELKEYLNRGYLHLVTNTDYLEGSDSLFITASTQFYDLTDSCIKPLIVQFDDDADSEYDTLPYASFKEIYKIAGDDLWTKSDTPKYWFLWQRKIGFWPIPESTITDGGKVLFTKRPDEMSDSTDTADIPDQFQEGIIFYAAEQASIKARRFDDSLYFKSRYIEIVMAMKAFMSRKSKDRVHQIRKYGDVIDYGMTGVLRSEDVISE